MVDGKTQDVSVRMIWVLDNSIEREEVSYCLYLFKELGWPREVNIQIHKQNKVKHVKERRIARVASK